MSVQPELPPQQVQAQLAEVMGSLPKDYEGRLREYSQRARQVFRNPDAVMLDISNYYGMLARYYPRQRLAEQYYEGVANRTINSAFDICSREGIADPDAAWRQMTTAYPILEEGRIIMSHYERESRFFLPLFQEAQDPNDLIHRLAAFSSLGRPEYGIYNFDLIEYHDKTPRQLLQDLNRATEPHVTERARQLNKQSPGLGHHFIRAVIRHPEDAAVYFRVQAAGNDPVERTRQLHAEGKNVSLDIHPGTGLILADDMRKGHEEMARDAGVCDTAGNLDRESYGRYATAMMPCTRRRGRTTEPTISIAPLQAEDLRDAIRHLHAAGFDPELIVKVPQAHMFSTAGFRLRSLADPKTSFSVDTEHRSKQEWSCLSRNGVDIWRYDMPDADTRVLGGVVMVRGSNVYTGDMALSVLGGDVSVSVYCAAHTAEDGSITLSGHIPKHESHEPDPAAVAQVMRKFDPNLVIHVGKVSGKKVN